MDQLPELQIELKCFLSDEELTRNLDVNLQRKCLVVKEGMLKGKTASLCGSGPSISESVDNLRGDVWACNGAYNWLLDQGVIADFFFCWDPGKEVLPYISRAHPDTTFVIASTCDPEVFEALQTYKVLMWHADTGGEKTVHNAMLKHERRGEFYVGGGSACITRAPYLLRALGYSEIHLHGADSSLTDDGKSHIAEGIIGEGVNKISCLGRDFLAPLWMGAQSQQFLPMVQNMPEVKFVVHGDGLIPHIAKMYNLHYTETN